MDAFELDRRPACVPSYHWPGNVGNHAQHYDLHPGYVGRSVQAEWQGEHVRHSVEGYNIAGGSGTGRNEAAHMTQARGSDVYQTLGGSPAYQTQADSSSLPFGAFDAPFQQFNSYQSPVQSASHYQVGSSSLTFRDTDNAGNSSTSFVSLPNFSSGSSTHLDGSPSSSLWPHQHSDALPWYSQPNQTRLNNDSMFPGASSSQAPSLYDSYEQERDQEYFYEDTPRLEDPFQVHETQQHDTLRTSLLASPWVRAEHCDASNLLREDNIAQMPENPAFAPKTISSLSCGDGDTDRAWLAALTPIPAAPQHVVPQMFVAPIPRIAEHAPRLSPSPTATTSDPPPSLCLVCLIPDMASALAASLHGWAGCNAPDYLRMEHKQVTRKAIDVILSHYGSIPR